ncbi:MAG: hypothetical protein GPJ52_02845 [Candidatus Heimdallarchaeota archaeon]|nr:hypothetical protein [Candidatus Heimdallarchaeota archaeon]
MENKDKWWLGVVGVLSILVIIFGLAWIRPNLIDGTMTEKAIPIVVTAIFSIIILLMLFFKFMARIAPGIRIKLNDFFK